MTSHCKEHREPRAVLVNSKKGNVPGWPRDQTFGFGTIPFAIETSRWYARMEEAAQSNKRPVTMKANSNFIMEIGRAGLATNIRFYDF
jgi:hypothetical protein